MRLTKSAVCVLLFAMHVANPASAQQPRVSEARTPETRTLTAEEAARALERDWLFQAMGEPLLARAAQEIGWARELAERLGRQPPAPDLSAELRELDALEQRLGELQATPAPASGDSGGRGGAELDLVSRGQRRPKTPRPQRGSSAAGSSCRRRCARPSCGWRRTTPARCSSTAQRVGSHETWQRTAVFAVGPLLKPAAMCWPCGRRTGRRPARIPPA